MARTPALAVFAILAAALAGAAPVLARGKILKVPEVLEEPADRFTKLIVKDDPAAVAYMLEAIKPADGEKLGLLVSLHGHGGEPKSLMFPQIAQKRRLIVLGVQGHTPTGPGFAWSENDKEIIAGFTLWVLETRPVDPKRVFMTGHSAGGTMTLATCKFAPQLFAGIMTTAAPATPDTGHYDVRTVVFLGDQDPNFAGAGAVRSNFENKKRRAPGSLRIVRGLGHDLPDPFYMDQALLWLLETRARGFEISLPKDPPVKDDRPFAHILLRWSGAEGADARTRGVSKARAQGEIKMIRKFLEKKMGHVFMEAAKFSQDDATAPSGGLVDAAGLEAFAPALRQGAEKLEPGGLSEVLESPQGWHLVWRLPVPDEGGESGK